MINKSKIVKRESYNIKMVLPLASIPLEERDKALRDFSEGSFGLKKCLKLMWDNGLNTVACCPGRYGSFNAGYITMEPGIDLFGYLSKELLDNDMVKIWISNGRQVIGFAGSRKKRERILRRLHTDIMDGKKDNEPDIIEKLCKGYPISYLVNKKERELTRKGISGENLEEELYFYYSKYEQEARARRDKVMNNLEKIKKYLL